MDLREVTNKPQCGKHSAFADLYESFLDAAYRSPSSKGNDRWKLVQGIVNEIAERGVETILDCAAGTGFPAIELAAHPTIPWLKVHCTDADAEMLQVFEKRVKETEDINLQQFAAPRGLKLGGEAAGSLRLAWHELGNIRRTYDYVMCRGNSLAYGNTWSGGRSVSSADAIGAYLQEMKNKVRPGGYLHVDAPKRLELPKQCYPSVAEDGVVISEEVVDTDNHRHWKVQFELPNGEKLGFHRYSTLLTISNVQRMLDDLGFVDTAPRALYGERPGFGVIIAKRPE